MNVNVIFIPGKTPSSKNSRLKTKNGAFIASKATRAWQKATATYWGVYKNTFLQQLNGLSKPYIISFKYVRGTKITSTPSKQFRTKWFVMAGWKMIIQTS